MTLTLFDYVAIAIVVLSLILGGFRGMAKEVLSLVNLVLAFWVANRYGGELVVYLDWAEDLSDPMKALIGVAGAFFGSMLVGAIIIALIGRIVSAAGLGFADRGLGVAFGVARGVLIVLGCVVAAGFTSLPEKEFWKEAAFAPMAVDLVLQVKPHLPESVANWIRY